MIRTLVFCSLIAVALTAGKDTCNYKGKIYHKGDGFKDDCNRCFCGGNDMVGCTKMLCIHDVYELKEDTCDHKGTIYKKGESFMDDCNTCFCGGNGMVGCTRMLCRPRHDAKDMTAVDHDTCIVDGKVYKRGESFKKKCNTCFCAGNNVAGCTLMSCPSDEPVSYANSETCTRDGKVYKKGDNFSLDGCNICFCGGNDMIGCTKKLCPPKGCYYNGKLHQVGEHFKKECNRCICTKGGAACTKMACRPGH